MTNITKEQFTQFIITNGIDEDGAEVVFELTCGCMAYKDGENHDLVLCAGHDDEDIDNNGKSFTELVSDIYVAPVTEEAPVVEDDMEEDELPEAFNEVVEETTLDDLVGEETITEEKDEEIMAITMKNTVAQMKEFAAANNIDIKGLKVKAAIFARITGADKTVEEVATEAPVVEEELTLDDMVADDAPMVDELQSEEVVEEETVEAQPADAVALAQELLDLLAKGTNFSTLAQKVRENATAIVNGTQVKSEPKKTEKPAPTNKPVEQKPVKTEKPKQQAKGASEASVITKFSTARIIEHTATSVTFEGDGKQYIFLKNEAGKTIIRAIGSNSNQYMSAKYLQHLVYDINTAQSRALFRKVKAVGAATAPSKSQGDGAASEASAKEKNNTAKNNSAEVITMLGTEIPKAWFTQYVQDKAMTKKHGSSKMTATTIIAEYKARKA